MAEILWHRRETRRQTENTNVCLNGGKAPAYSPGSKSWLSFPSMVQSISIAIPIPIPIAIWIAISMKSASGFAALSRLVRVRASETVNVFAIWGEK